jgi:hypothetical protein
MLLAADTFTDLQCQTYFDWFPAYNNHLIFERETLLLT